MTPDTGRREGPTSSFYSPGSPSMTIVPASGLTAVVAASHESDVPRPDQVDLTDYPVVGAMVDPEDGSGEVLVVGSDGKVRPVSEGLDDDDVVAAVVPTGQPIDRDHLRAEHAATVYRRFVIGQHHALRTAKTEIALRDAWFLLESYDLINEYAEKLYAASAERIQVGSA